MIQPEPEKQFTASTIIIGVAGLLLVGYGAFAYLQGHGFFGGRAGAPAVVASGTVAVANNASSSVTGYAAVGQSTTTKTVTQSVSTAGASAGVTTATAAPQNVIPTLPFQEPPFNGADWIYDWGAASITNNGLVFGAATSSTGGDLFLASSSAWTNYTVSANVDWQAGASFGIIARLSDTKDFVYCDFANNTAAIVQRTDGVDATIAQGATSNGGAGTIEHLGISVYGKGVACTVDGAEVLGASIAQNDPASGGIGLISWDATPGVSKISVNNISAAALSSDNIATPFPIPVAPTSTSVTAMASSSAAATAPAQLQLPYNEFDFANDANWQKTWGGMMIDNSNFMDIGSATGTSGGTTVLQNTDGWINYSFATTLDWAEGETFMVIGRYVDANDYVACNFVRDPNQPGAAEIELEKFVKGSEATLQTGEDTNFAHEGNDNIQVVLSLQGPDVTCSFNNHSISNTGSGSYGVSPVAGGIGFSTWDPTIDNSQIIVKDVAVTTNY